MTTHATPAKATKGRRAPVSRGIALALPGMDSPAEESTLTQSTRPANDADARAVRAVRRAKAMLGVDFSAQCAAAMAPALGAVARMNGSTEATSDGDEAALNALPLRTDLACRVVVGDDGQAAVKVEKTLWAGEARVSVIYVTPDGTRGGHRFTCRSVEDVERRVSGWLARYSGPVAVAQADEVDVEADGRMVLRLRWRDGAWRDAAEVARLDAEAARRDAAPAQTAEEVAAAIDAEVDAAETAEAVERQRKAVAGLSLRCLDEPVVKVVEPASVATAPTSVTTPKRGKLRAVPSVAPTATKATKPASGGPSKPHDAVRERAAARKPSKATRGAS